MTTMKFTVISFYTIGTGYEQEIKSLVQSLDKFGIRHCIRGIQNRGGWHKNSMYKPIFIREQLASMDDQALVWLDADSVVLQYPRIFDNIITDVAFYFRTTGNAAQRFGGEELITASMYFSNTFCARALVDLWIDETRNNQQQDRNLVEQRSLQRVLPAWREKCYGTITYLPQSYCRIFDAPEDHRVIVQNQASRRFRSEVGE